MARKMPDGVRLSSLIAPAFYPVFWDIMDECHTYYNLYGGRGSTKSSFIGTMIPLGMMQDPEANAVVFRKVASTIGTSVFEQIVWSLNQMGVLDDWKITTSPYKLTYKRTGQVILFRGLDKAKKMKSIKVSRGYLKYCWFEELDEFAGDEEIRTVQQSVLRGGPKFIVFKGFNPPISKSNWANEYVMTPKSDALMHKSCYLDVPSEWLGEQFFNDAEDLKETNPRAYEHEYLGNAVGTGGEVFDNLEIRPITDEEVVRFDRIYMGIDFGWYPDPFHWSKSHYDAARKTLYIFDEFRANKLSNAEAWNTLVMKKGVTGSDLITADSAEPKSVADFREYGALCRGAIKGPDSVRYGMKWLQSLKAIVIDPARCPYTAKEFSHYEYERTPNDEIMSSFPDADNHCLAGDTIVNTVDGDFKITELIGKTGKVKCYDTESGEETISCFYDVKKTLRNAQLYQITLEDGGILKLTDEHPVYTQRGWVMVKDLKPDDSILKING